MKRLNPRPRESDAAPVTTAVAADPELVVVAFDAAEAVTSPPPVALGASVSVSRPSPPSVALMAVARSTVDVPEVCMLGGTVVMTTGVMDTVDWAREAPVAEALEAAAAVAVAVVVVLDQMLIRHCCITVLST